jgi:hypothetical protein
MVMVERRGARVAKDVVRPRAAPSPLARAPATVSGLPLYTEDIPKVTPKNHGAT